MTHPLYQESHPAFTGASRKGSAVTVTSGSEFIDAILGGQRDFTGLCLEDNFSLDGHRFARDVQSYLLSANLEEQPLVLNRGRLKGLRATHLNLAFTEAEGADCANANFTGCVFRHALLRGVGFQAITLCEANLEFADMHAAFLHNANCTDANFHGVYLHGSVLNDAVFDRAKLTEAHLDSAYSLRASFRHADLSGAELTYGVFRNATFCGATLTGARLHWAQFRGADKETAIVDPDGIKDARWESIKENADNPAA
jgi:uncharacterized protein YjbI with pentapeptide repeats